FNHESPRRGENFVTRKICRGAAAIKLGLERELSLGDTSAQRDWGHARDYVRGMWLALNFERADDFVFATGQLHSVQDVVEIAFATVQLDPKQYVKKDARFLRPAEPLHLVGNATKAKQLLQWQPQISFPELVKQMTEAELTSLGQIKKA
ncbi:MAG TPA: GDP-mannose 4,6-dehydratase, partial [Verrucomicrobiae bacterium]|nr:GDP-mannose 4,6-dehydratase [Verrucomicrobiae bacterium]